MFLFLGWGGLVTQPLAVTFGRRPVYLVSQVAHIAVLLWMTRIGSSGEWCVVSSFLRLLPSSFHSSLSSMQEKLVKLTPALCRIGNKVIQGLVCSPVEMLVELSISDLVCFLLLPLSPSPAFPAHHAQPN
jgi:hypothetical protein